MAEVLVTGSGGFIGRALVPRLRRLGYTVAEIVASAQCDMRNLSSLRPVIGTLRPATIVHLAATPDTGAVGIDLEPGIVQPALNLMTAARGLDCHVIHVGSYKQYGRVGLPFRESDRVRPTTRYGYSKHRAEMIVRQAERRGDCCATLLRLGPVFGPGQNTRSLVARLIEVMGQGGTPLPVGVKPWDPIYIDDAVDAIIHAVRSEGAIGQVLNVSGGAATTPAEVAQLVGEEFGLPSGTIRHRAPISSDLGWDCLGDIGRAVEVIGWRPLTGVTGGVRRTVDAWRDRHRQPAAG